MKKKTILPVLAASLMVACVNEEKVLVNPDPQGNAITFSPVVGRHTRAVETSIRNLGSFGVIARSLDENAQFYEAYLIGEQDKSTTVVTPAIARKEGLSESNGNQGYWALPYNVYWPTGVNTVLFWGVSMLQDTEADKAKTDMLDGCGAIKWSDAAAGPYMELTAKRAEQRNAPYTDGSLQRDLVAACSVESKHQASNNITLDFSHALAQIDIKATAGKDLAKNTHRVKVKGAWIVNAHSKARFESHIDRTDHDNIKTSTQWADWADKKSFGSYFANPISLTQTAQSILGNGGNMMLIPQTVPAWDQNRVQEEDYADCTTTDSYILLYCRIELVHEGKVHPGGESAGVITEGDNHVHQVFPVLAAGGDFNADQYGYTCIPVEINWEAGKKYTYVLDICGANSGGGVYPPQIPDPDVPGIDPVVPDGKKPGDPVLDSPIKFTVTVDDWQAPDGWEDGGKPMPMSMQ